MKNNSIKTIGALALIASIPCLLLLGLISRQTAYQPVTAFQNDDCANGNCPKKVDESFWQRTTHDPVATFTAVLTVSTIGLCWATFRLWRSTERLVLGAETSAQHQLRAYVAFDGIRINRVFTENGKIASLSFTPVFKNFGQTVATHVVGYTVLTFSADREGADVDYSRIPKSRDPTITAPGQDDFGAPTKRILMSEFRTIYDSGLTIVIYGAVNYMDVFQTKRRTEFSVFYSFEALEAGDGNIVFMKSAKHNAADDDCAYRPYYEPPVPREL